MRMAVTIWAAIDMHFYSALSPKVDDCRELIGRRSQRLILQMGIPLRGRRLDVTKKLSDDLQAYSVGNEMRSKAVPQIMDPHRGPVPRNHFSPLTLHLALLNQTRRFAGLKPRAFE